jgi:hypothetical protein
MMMIPEDIVLTQEQTFNFLKIVLLHFISVALL